MDYYKLTKEHMRNYSFYHSSLDAKKRRLLKLTGAKPSGIDNMATDYSKERSNSSPVFDFTDDIATEIIKLEREVSKLVYLLENINTGYNKLDDLTKRILQMKYINSFDKYYSWPKLAVEFNLEINDKKKNGEQLEYLSESTIRRKATKGIAQIAVQIYGVLKEVKRIS